MEATLAADAVKIVEMITKDLAALQETQQMKQCQGLRGLTPN